MLFCPAALPLSLQTLDYAAGIIRRHRKHIGSPWRKLSPGRQALLAGLPAQRGDVRRAGRRDRHGLEVCHRDGAAAGRPVAEAAPGAADAGRAGHAYVVTDGTFFPVDRVAADRPFYSASTAVTG